ncbi:rod shape-determining protein MreD [uncultured Roseobacter sp.]|uniref:rod shape-determining protein MreD n=1 Tax=uncultured Roseobacter sp. TaxID=114847 RepID=UPI0026218AC3|nr:rod shape-determining protein MreD [uncultured Roseobacter sp.]
MTDAPVTKLWSMRLTFAFLVCVILFFQLLPLNLTPSRWAGPDLLLAFACAWSVRRPEYVPALGLALLFLLADLLLQRPPGLWALLALLGCENLKSRARAVRDGTFPGEWLTVCVMIAAISIAYRLGLMITLVDPPALGLSFSQLAMTLICYPAVVAVTHTLLGVRKSAPGDPDTAGGLR